MFFSFCFSLFVCLFVCFFVVVWEKKVWRPGFPYRCVWSLRRVIIIRLCLVSWEFQLNPWMSVHYSMQGSAVRIKIWTNNKRRKGRGITQKNHEKRRKRRKRRREGGTRNDKRRLVMACDMRANFLMSQWTHEDAWVGWMDGQGNCRRRFSTFNLLLRFFFW